MSKISIDKWWLEVKNNLENIAIKYSDFASNSNQFKFLKEAADAGAQMNGVSGATRWGVTVDSAAEKLTNGVPSYEEKYSEASIALLTSFADSLFKYENVEYGWLLRNAAKATGTDLNATFPKNKKAAKDLEATVLRIQHSVSEEKKDTPTDLIKTEGTEGDSRTSVLTTTIKTNTLTPTSTPTATISTTPTPSNSTPITQPSSSSSISSQSALTINSDQKSTVDPQLLEQQIKEYRKSYKKLQQSLNEQEQKMKAIKDTKEKHINKLQKDIALLTQEAQKIAQAEYHGSHNSNRKNQSAADLLKKLNEINGDEIKGIKGLYDIQIDNIKINIKNINEEMEKVKQVHNTARQKAYQAEFPNKTPEVPTTSQPQSITSREQRIREYDAENKKHFEHLNDLLITIKAINLKTQEKDMEELKVDLNPFFEEIEKVQNKIKENETLKQQKEILLRIDRIANLTEEVISNINGYSNLDTDSQKQISSSLNGFFNGENFRTYSTDRISCKDFESNISATIIKARDMVRQNICSIYDSSALFTRYTLFKTLSVSELESAILPQSTELDNSH